MAGAPLHCDPRAVETALGRARAGELFGELAAAAGGRPELAQAMLDGIGPFLALMEPADWLAESRNALAELGPLFALVAEEAAAPRAAGTAGAAPGARVAAPAARPKSGAYRPEDLGGLALGASLAIALAESGGGIGPGSEAYVSPYDGTRIGAAWLEGAIDAALGAATGTAPGAAAARRRLGLYTLELARSRGAAFAASALALSPRPADPEEHWFAHQFRGLALYLRAKKGADLSLAAAIVRDAFPRNGFGYREGVMLLADYLVDERFTASSLDPLLSFSRTCAMLFHPDRTRAFASILRLVKDFVRQAKSTDEALLALILRTFLEHPHLDLSEWVGEGARIVRATGASSRRTRAFFDRSSEASARIWESIDVGIPFERAAPRLGPFVAALSETDARLAKSPDGTGTRHLFMTDGRTIYVPAYAMYAKDREDNYLMLRHGAAHECAHIEFGSFADDDVRQRAAAAALDRLFPGAWERNHQAARRYLARVVRSLEARGYRVVSSTSAFPEGCPPLSRLHFRTPFPMLHRDLLNIVEDRRVNALLYAKYPGFRGEKARVDELDFAELPDLGDVSPEARLIQAFIERLWFGTVKGELDPEDSGALDALCDIVLARDPFAADVYDSAMAAGEALAIAIAQMRARFPEAWRRLSAKAHTLGADLALVGARGQGRNGALELELEAQRRAAAGGGSSPEDRARAEGAKSEFARAAAGSPLSFQDASLEGRPLFLYPEWMEDSLAYERDLCLLAEFPPPAAPGASSAALRATPGADAARRAFAAMKEGLDTLERGAEDGEDIDFDRAVDCFMDIRAGSQVDADFYLRRTRRLRDLLCALVLDMSPSTKAVVNGASIFEHERRAAYIMAEAMASIGDRFGLFSYYDFGAKANIFHVIKAFDEAWDSRAVDCLAGLRSAEHGFSRIAPGMRHVLAKMRSEEARTKIAFFVTDGQPVYLQSVQDRGETSKTYHVDGREIESQVAVRVRRIELASSRHAYADLAKVAEEACLEGVRLFCVTLDRESLEPLGEIFGEDLVCLEDAAALPARLVELFRRMTR